MIGKDFESSIDSTVIYKFRKEQKFSDLLLVSWGLVESGVDLALQRSFGIAYNDPKNDLILHNSFSRKIEVLKKTGYFLPKEYKALLDFASERNAMFHKLFKGLIFDVQKPELREKIMDKAIIAVQICNVAWTRNTSTIITKFPDPFKVWNADAIFGKK